MTDRRRNGLILLLVAGLLAASLAVIATKPTRLGLDLQGGVELVYQGKPTPQQPQVTPEALDRAIEIMRKRVDKLGVAEPEIQRSGNDQISVGLPDVKNAARAEEQVGNTAQLYFYNWEKNVIGPGGKPDPFNQEVTGGPAAGQTGALTLYEAVKRASLRPKVERPNNTVFGNTYYAFTKSPENRYIAGPEASVKDLFSEKARPPGAQIFAVKPGTVVVQAEKPQGAPANAANNRYFVLDDNPALSGTDIKDPKQEFNDQAGGAPIVTFKFTDSGRKDWEQVTKDIADQGNQQQILSGGGARDSVHHFAAVLDGQLITVPFIDYTQNPNGIDGRTGSQIEGGFTIQSAQDLASLLQLGALPIKLELISQSQVSATLGKQALDQGLIAGIAGFLIVVLFLIAVYRVLGLIAAGALVIYAIYFFALIKLIPITLTLPGIAGLILTIGVAADANIVIFERVKEEVRAGRSIPAAIAAGYKKGLSAIIDANVVTILTAFILFILATAGVKGFAFTLGVGTIVSLFTAVLATQAILGTMSRSRLLASPAALGAGKPKRAIRFDFMGASKWFFSLSGMILLVGALAIGGKGINFGIDFEGGTRITTALERPADEGEVRSVLAGAGFADAEIQRVNDKQLGANVFQISTSELGPNDVQKVRAGLDQRYGVGNNFSNTSIGATFGQTVARTAILAIIASLLVISSYIALRFEWKFAVPVLIAVMHDLLITAGVYSLLGREVTVSTVAALLTILGFSLYDTIIVFDRVRENVPRMPRAAFSQIVNRSMSEVIVRSLATSLSTLLPVLALFFFGGDTLKDFAFALAVGILSGTYSSIFIASPVLTHWKEREPVYVRRRERIERSHGGLVPAYAESAAGAPADVEPEPGRRGLRGRRRITEPEEPGQISREEFDDLVADLETDKAPKPAATATKPKPKHAPAAEPEPHADAEAEAGEASTADRGADAAEGPAEFRHAPDEIEEPVAPSSRTSSTGPKRPKQKRPRNRRHGRSR